MILSNCNLKLQTWFNSHLLPGPSWAHCRLAACNMEAGEAITPSILSWLPSCWYWLLWGQRMERGDERKISFLNWHVHKMVFCTGDLADVACSLLVSWALFFPRSSSTSLWVCFFLQHPRDMSEYYQLQTLINYQRWGRTSEDHSLPFFHFPEKGNWGLQKSSL